MQKNVLLILRIIAIGLLFLPLISGAQQDAQYTQYMYNTMTVNPAYAGSREKLSIAALYRAQWLGLDGAPETQTFNMHTPIGTNGVGLGLSILNDKIGPTQETYLDVDFSYTISLNDDRALAFGLKSSAHLLDIRYSELNQDQTQGMDVTLQQDIDNRFSPNVGAGVYYYTGKSYVGLSVPRILKTTHFQESSLSTAEEEMTFYGIAGHVWDLNPKLKFKPALLTKITQGAPLQVDLSANFMFQEKFIGGVAYRWDAAVSGLVGFQASPDFLIGIAYDRELTALGAQTFNDGSFEVILRYDVKPKGKPEVKSPRFF